MSIDFEEQLRATLHDTLGDGPSDPTTWKDIAPRARRAERSRHRRSLVGTAVMIAIVTGLVVVAVRDRTNPSRRLDSIGPAARPAPARRASPETTPHKPQPGTVQVLSSTDLGPKALPDALAVTGSGAWVSLWGRGEVLRVGPSGVVTGHVPVGASVSGPLDLAAGEGAIWVLDFDSNSLLRVDPLTARVTGRRHLPAEAERVAVANGKVWVTGCCDAPATSQHGNQRLYRINPKTLRVEHELSLPGNGEGEQVRAGPAGIFVAGEGFTTVARIDPTGTRIISQDDVKEELGDGCRLVVGSGVACTFNTTTQRVRLGRSGPMNDVQSSDKIYTAVFHQGHLLGASNTGILRLNGSRWTSLRGGPPAVSLLASSNATVWAVQGNRLLHLAIAQ